MIRICIASLALLALLSAVPAHAAPPAEEAGCELRVATGPRGKVYEKLFADMRSACGSAVALCAVPSEGGLQNLSLLSASQADVGLAQLDTVATMTEGDDSVGQLQVLMPLHSNLLHVLSLSAGSKVDTMTLLGKPVPGTGRMVGVRSFADLRGLRVAAVGSAQLMGRTLDKQLGYGLQFENADSDEQALEMLRADKVQAVFTTVGWPSPGEGIHLRVPVLQTLHPMDVRVARSEGEGDAASKDLQAVRVKVILNYHLDPQAVPRAFRQIVPSTEEVAARIIEPARPEAFKAVTAQFTAEELVTRRSEVSERIAAQLREKLARHGLVLDEFSVANFAFSASFTSAIEAKVNAEQKKLEADRDLLRIRVEAEQRITSADAEAQALRLQRQEVTPLLLELRRAENERLAVGKWNGHLPTTTMGSGAVPFIKLPADG